MCFFFNDTSTTETYTYLHTLSLHDALPLVGIDEVEGLVRRHLVAHVVEHEELGFRSPERDVADAAGLQVLAGKHGGRARVAIVELAANRVDDIAEQDELRKVAEGIHDRGAEIGPQDHVGLVADRK